MNYPEHADDSLSAGEAFLAMEHFLKAFWQPDGKNYDGLARVLSFIDISAGLNRSGPVDPAMWSDWIEAIDAVRSLDSSD